MLTDQTPLAISTDVVLFSIHNERLEVLLIPQQDGYWSLPGGHLAADEDLDSSVLRHLREQTGMVGVYLEQLYTFGRCDRNPWQRMVSVAYYALVSPHKLQLCHSAQEAKLQWFATDKLPRLVLDHDQIITLAQRRLAAKLAYSTIALQFLPERFTLSDLQRVYETILDEVLDKRNFRKRVLTMDCIEATGELSRLGNHRPAKLYRAKRLDKIEIIK
jgi:8-oxo-dGTP diphosphatase